MSAAVVVDPMDERLLRAPAAIQRRLLLEVLRQIRHEAGMTQQAVARRLGISHATMMRTEAGQIRLTEARLRAALELYGVPGPVLDRAEELRFRSDLPQWWSAHRKALAGQEQAVVALRSGAAAVTEWANTLVPELLRTPAYQERILAVTGVPAEQRATRVRLLGAEQERSAEQGQSGRYLVAEAVVRAAVGGARAAAEQTEVLIGRARAGVLRVVPYAAGHHRGVGGSWAVWEYGGVWAAVHRPAPVEFWPWPEVLESPEEVREYQGMFGELEELALDGSGSVALLEEIRAGHVAAV